MCYIHLFRTTFIEPFFPCTFAHCLLLASEYTLSLKLKEIIVTPSSREIKPLILQPTNKHTTHLKEI